MMDRDDEPSARLSVSENERATRRQSRLSLFLVGVLCLAAVIGVTLRFGEINAFAAQASRAEPIWLLCALAAQTISFLCASFIWWAVLRKLALKVSLLDLFPLSVAKLFADQALPSGGVSGALFIMHALKRRGAAWDQAFTAFVFGSGSFIVAFVVAAVISLAVLAATPLTPPIVTRLIAVFSAAVFGALAIGAALAVFADPIRRRMESRPAIRRAASFARLAVRTVIAERGLFAGVAGVQLGARALDALTLWFTFFAIGAETSYAAAFVAVSVASVAATIAPTPMGLGPFEAAIVGVFTVYGTPVETALTTCLLYRGFSLWLPLVPGFVVAQRELLLTPPQFRITYAD